MSDGECRSQTGAPQEAPTRWARILPYLPSTLLVLVAVNQLILAYTANLSAWLGGGFGMFSTIDDGDNRHLRVFTVRAGREEEVEIPSALEDLDQRTRVLPSPSQLRKFAQAVATLYGNEGKRFSAVRIEVWRTTFDADSRTPRSQRLREFILTIDGEPH